MYSMAAFGLENTCLRPLT